MSLEKVAFIAGVSKSTASRVINRESNVSPEAIQRVREAIKTADYRPERRKKSGRRRRIAGRLSYGNIGLVVLGEKPDAVDPAMVSYFEMLESIQGNLNKMKFNLMIFYENSLGSLDEQPLDGLLLLGKSRNFPQVLRRLLGTVPGVIISEQGKDPHALCDRVIVNAESVGVLAARYLIDKGHRDIALFNPYYYGHSYQRKISQGFFDCCRDAGIEPRRYLSETRPDVSFHEHMMVLFDEMLNSSPRPRGVFITYSERAVELYPHFRSVGIEPMRDIDIVTFTSQRLGENGSNPIPAWVQLDYAALARRGVEALMWRMTHPKERNHWTLMQEPLLRNAPWTI